MCLLPHEPSRARAARVVRVKGRAALLALTCGPGAECAGTARLSVPVKAPRRSSRHKPRRVTIGGATLHLVAGRHRTVKVPLTKRGRMLLRAHGHRGLAARLGGTGVVGRGVVLEAVGHRHRH